MYLCKYKPHLHPCKIAAEAAACAQAERLGSVFLIGHIFIGRFTGGEPTFGDELVGVLEVRGRAGGGDVVDVDDGLGRKDSQCMMIHECRNMVEGYLHL